MQTIHYIVLGCCVWVLLGLFFWAQFHNSKGEQIDLDEADEHYVDQDGERVYYADGLGAVGTRSDPDAWKHATVKVPHAGDV